MSKIFDRLKQAEAQRKRVLTGRGTGEARAARKTAPTPTVPALIVAVPAEEIALKEALERAQERPAPPAPSGKRLWLAAGALAIVGFLAAVGLQGTASKKEMSSPAAVDFQLKLDRDAEGFAARAGKRGRQ